MEKGWAVLIPLFAGVRIRDVLLCFELELDSMELDPLLEPAIPVELDSSYADLEIPLQISLI